MDNITRNTRRMSLVHHRGEGWLFAFSMLVLVVFGTLLVAQ